MNQQVGIDESIVIGKPSVALGGEGAAYGIHLDGGLRYGRGVVLIGWMIGDLQIRLCEPAGELQQPVFVSFGERADLRASYELPPSVPARSFICCVTEFSGEALGVAGFADGRRRVLARWNLPAEASVEEVKSFLSKNLDKAGAIVRAMSGQRDWMSLLFPLLPALGDQQKVARVNIEEARVVPGIGGLAVGWAFSVGDSELFAITEEGWCSSFANAARWHRPDIIDVFSSDFGNESMNAGFVVALPPHLQGGAEVVIICAAQASAFRVQTRKVDVIAEDPAIFARWSFLLPTATSNFAQHYTKLDGPILANLIRGKRERYRGDLIRVEMFGEPVLGPTCSVIVPLYGRHDFMLNQFLEFDKDDDFHQKVDLIYVIDDPRISASVIADAQALHQYHRIPFRVIDVNANLGYSAANNVGVDLSRAERVLLLNSDVIPAQSGWVSKMEGALLEDDSVGVVGARLYYPNGTIQHNGISFEWYQPWGAYINKHPGIGMPAAMPSSTPTDRVAVTGACMLLRRADYRKVSGLDEEYLIGDFEDTDLCLKIRSLGKSVVCIEDVQLIHLERQSFVSQGSGTFRARVTEYNARRHQERWGVVIREINSGEL